MGPGLELELCPANSKLYFVNADIMMGWKFNPAPAEHWPGFGDKIVPSPFRQWKPKAINSWTWFEVGIQMI